MATISTIKNHPEAFYIIPDATIPIVAEVVKVDYSKVSRKMIGERHLHHFHQMDVVLDGEFSLEIENGCKYSGAHGDAWIIPPLLWHRLNYAKPFRYVSFKFHVNPRFWYILGNEPNSFRMPEHLCRSIIDTCESCITEGKFVSQRISAIITLCLSEFIRQCPQTATVPHELEGIRQELWPLLEKMQMGQGRLWTVEQMAKEMGLSRDYFSRCFRQIVGQSPHLYIIETTMRTAAASLTQVPGKPIKKIAEDAGYSTVQSFSSAFKKVFKISPAAYRTQALRHEH